MASVTVRNIRKSFGSTEVVHGVDIDIEDGEFVVLVGPSGCGKSTLLRMMAGLESITSGELLIGDRVVNMVPPKERDTAMVFQNYALYPHMKVYDNMAFSLKLRKVDAAEIRERVERAAEILGLTPYLDRFPRQLSGGQRQRVAMGRAIVRKPQVFLFDEPLSNLDAKLRVQMRTEIRELHQRLDATSVYVTHDQIEAMTMAEGEVASDAGNPILRVTEELSLPLPPAPSLEAGRKLIYGTRPEDLELTANGSGVEVEIAVVEPTGAETLIMSHLGKQQMLASFKERHELRPGQKIHLAPHMEKLHLFDADNGQRI
jgi:multiple sugar transport system ATP-binding protein